MAERRWGVFLASSRFPEEPRLPPLRCPENDVDGMWAALTENGDFNSEDTYVLKNEPHHKVLRRMNEVLKGAGKDDLVLLYYAGHGKQDSNGRLHLATTNTIVNYLESTSIRVEDIRYMIENARSSRIVLILDCCYSGAAADAFLRSGVDDQLQRVSSGRGTYILTASTGLQVAQERESEGHGLLTKHIIHGVRQGTADLDRDGLITMDELYHYVHDRVLDESSQTPEKYALRIRGELVLARTRRIRQESTSPSEPEETSTIALPRYRLERIIQEQNRGTLSVVFTPRGTMVITGGGDGYCRAYRTFDGALQHVFKAHEGSVCATVFNHDGGYFASGGTDSLVRIARYPGTEAVHTLRGHTGPVIAVAFSANGRFLASAGFDGIIRVWDAATGEPAWSLQVNATVHALAFSPDDRFLASGSEDAIVRLWPATEPGPARLLKGHRRAVLSLSFSSDRAFMASGGRDGMVRVWDTDLFQTRKALAGHTQSVWSTAFTTLPRVLVSGGGDERIFVWNPGTGREAQALQSGQGCVHAVDARPDSNLLASGGSDQTLRLWTRQRDDGIKATRI